MRRFLLLSAFLLVEAHAAPQRVVSLGGDITEIAFALGRGEAVAAVDTTSTFPAEAAGRPKVGYVRALSAEGVLAMKPDLILASGDAGPVEVIDQLKAAGIPVVVVPKDHSLEGIQRKILAVADALEAEAEGERLATRFDAQRRETEDATRTGEPLPAVFVMARGDGALIAAGEGTAADAMLRAAGLRNVFTGSQGYKPVSAEALVALAPAVVVTGTRTVAASGGLDRFKQNPALQTTPAVLANRVLVFDDMYLLGLGPRAAQAARELATAARR